MTVDIGSDDRPDTRVRRLSLAQEQLWFLDQLAPGEATYTVLMVWRLRGPLRVDLLRRALTLVVARHEALRVTIDHVEGEPYQRVTPAGEVPLPVTDLRTLPPAEREQRVRAEIDARRDEPFDLAAGPLCRFALLRVADDEYVFCQGFHHIVTDGWSAAVVNTELAGAYRSLHAGGEPTFDDADLDFTGYAQAQRDRLTGAVLAEELAFWRERLAGLPVLDLPADRPRPGAAEHRGATLIRQFPADLRGLVQRLADDHNASPFMVLAAAFDLVLSRYTGAVDVPVGVPMLGRPEPELEALVGMFVNMTVLRTDLSGDPTFGELIDRVADGTLELYEHQEVAFNQVVDAVRPVRDADRNPLFDVSLQLLGESNSGENLDLPEVTAEYVPLESRTSRFDMAINLIDTGDGLRANVEYASDLFDRWRIEALLGHLETVLRGAAADPDRRLSQLALVTGAEAEQLLAAGRDADATGPVYVVDPTLNLLPRGVPGELLRVVEPTGTDPQAVADPFRPGGYVVRTGERVRWSADLRLETLEGPGDGAAPAGPTADAADDAPRTPTEQRVADIFGEVLSRDGVGAQESFFAVGGNSLQAMRVVSRINKGFGIKLSVRTMYGNPTVRAVAAAVDQKTGGSGA
ncbi:condensation domain-containing protein [Micromonospora sp. WMMA1923]|uniref:condensation domain-containing protein n=1 Tax=Micromonospora sp. WMMA1923 TaxID=3404125 RepID=UPI003B93A60C